MKSLESRINALEQLRPAPNVVFVAGYLPDGSLEPLLPGQVYARQVALIAAPCATTAEWLKRYAPKGEEGLNAKWEREQELIERAKAALVLQTRVRTGPGAGASMKER